MRRLMVRSLVVMLAVLAAMGGALRPTLGQIPAPLTPLELRAQPDRGLAPWPGAELQQASIAPLETLADVYSECTRIAYQSLVNSNWEIYSTRGDGRSPTRLTQNNTADESPALGVGCGLLAWASKRDGNFELYTMRSDGSQVTRLTNDAAADVLPALSPDGAQIAYQSTLSGENPEIYRIGVAGGGATRLTADGAYDGQPDWAPDGQRLAFISGRSGPKNVWTMDADGSDPRQVTTLSYAGGPKWSPDGQRIALAADDLGTGFTSLWVVGADGSNPRLVWRATQTNTDAWPNDWSFDGRYILFERATWYKNDGWYISGAALEAINPDDTADRRTLVEGGINLGGSWALCDTEAPSSQIDSLPLVSEAPIALAWRGSDDCDSSLEYQVAYRLGGTAQWVNWQATPASEWTTATAGLFDWGSLGSVLHFRSRARDSAGRVEAWPTSDGDAFTTLPAPIGGRVSDQRGAPVPGASVSGPAPYTQPTESSLNGRFALRAVSEGGATFTANAPGYRVQRLSLPGLTAVSDVLFSLRTDPELLQNGGFESGQANWFATLGATFEPHASAFDQRVARLGRSANSSANLTDLASAVWQEVRIPADMHKPTLSLMAVLGDGASAFAGTLQAAVTHSGEEIALTLAEPAVWITSAEGVRFPLWQPAHADLSPWAGQTITLTLRYTPGWSGSFCLLDEVSISPWLAPRVDAVSPRRLAPGVAHTLTVQGENMMPAAQVRLGATILTTRRVDDGTLQATVPPTMPLGTYDLLVVNSTGHSGGVSGAVTVGGVIALPLLRNAP